MTDTRVGPSGPQINPGPPPYTGPGSGLGEPRDNGWTWNPGAGQQFSQEAGWDQYGMLTGPNPLPPANVAMQFQAEHNRRVWLHQQSLMRSALGFGQGALGLLQSFRPGGSAALEAGQYNTLAQIQLQRAGMTQPLDLMGDYVRDQNARARMQANRQAERQLAVQGAAAIASLAGAFFTGGATLAMLPGALGAIAGSQYGGRAGGGMQGTGNGYQGSQPVGPNSPGQVPPAGGGPPQGPGLPGAPPAGGPSGPAGPPMPAPPGPQSPGPVNQQPITSPGGGQALASTLGASDGGGGAAGAAGGAPGGAMGAPGVGADGNFAPVAFAARAAATAGGDPFHTLAITRMVADELDSDPMWTRLAIGVDQRLAERLGVRAA